MKGRRLGYPLYGHDLSVYTPGVNVTRMKKPDVRRRHRFVARGMFTTPGQSEAMADVAQRNLGVPRVQWRPRDAGLAAALREQRGPGDPLHELGKVDAGDPRRLRQQTV